MRLLLVENILYALFGGALGVALAYAGVQALVAAWGLEHGGYWGCLHDGAVDPDGAPSFASLVKQAAEAPLPRGLRRVVRVLQSV